MRAGTRAPALAARRPPFAHLRTPHFPIHLGSARRAQRPAGSPLLGFPVRVQPLIQRCGGRTQWRCGPRPIGAEFHQAVARSIAHQAGTLIGQIRGGGFPLLEESVTRPTWFELLFFNEPAGSSNCSRFRPGKRGMKVVRTPPRALRRGCESSSGPLLTLLPGGGFIALRQPRACCVQGGSTVGQHIGHLR